MQQSLRSLPGRLTAALVARAIGHAWIVLLLAVLATGAALHYTASHIAIDTDTSNMLDPSLPHRQAHRRYRAAFPDLPGAVVVFAEGDSAGAVAEAGDAVATALMARPDIAQRVEQPGGGEFFATHGLLYLDTDALWALDERLQAAEPFLGTLAHDPSLRGIFTTLGEGLARTLDASQQDMLRRMFDRISDALDRLAQGDTRPVRWRDELFADDRAQGSITQRAFVLIDPVEANRDFQPEGPAIEALRELLDELGKQHREVRYRLTGPAVMDIEELDTVADEASLTTALSFLLVAVVLVAGLRSPVLVTGVLVTLAFGLIWTAAFASFAVGALNIISVCFAVLFIGMGVDFGIQFTMRYLEETDRGLARDAALVAAANGAGGALALAAVGAAICFLCFVPTAYLGLAQLGLISGFSMVIAWFANLTVLPALLRCLPMPRRRPRAQTRPTDTPDFVQRHWRPVLVISGLLVVGSLVALPFARFDLNPLNLKDGATEGVTAFRDLARDAESSPYPIQILAPSLPAAVTLAKSLEALPEVDMALTLDSYVPGAQADKLAIIEGMALALAGALDADTELEAVSAKDEEDAVARFRTAIAEARQRGGQTEAFSSSLNRLDTALAREADSAGGLSGALPALRAQLIGDLPATLARLSKLLEATEIELDDLPPTLRESFIAADGQARIQVMPSHDLNEPGAMESFADAVRASRRDSCLRSSFPVGFVAYIGIAPFRPPWSERCVAHRRPAGGGDAPHGGHVGGV
jgi:hopanoid biosynthesis associated RND transporter like protein HpnN